MSFETLQWVTIGLIALAVMKNAVHKKSFGVSE